MECGTPVKSIGRISAEQVAAAIQTVQSMSLAEKVALTEEVFAKQPNLLASCLVQPRLGVAAENVDFLLNLLLVCFQAMKQSRHDWPVISEGAQAQQMQRLTGTVLFSEDIADPVLASQARAQYLTDHPEAPLLAYILHECNDWLQSLTRRGAESETDKFVMIAACRKFLAQPRGEMRVDTWRDMFVWIELATGIAWGGMAVVGLGTTDAISRLPRSRRAPVPAESPVRTRQKRPVTLP